MNVKNLARKLRPELSDFKDKELDVWYTQRLYCKDTIYIHARRHPVEFYIEIDIDPMKFTQKKLNEIVAKERRHWQRSVSKAENCAATAAETCAATAAENCAAENCADAALSLGWFLVGLFAGIVVGLSMGLGLGVL